MLQTSSSQPLWRMRICRCRMPLPSHRPLLSHLNQLKLNQHSLLSLLKQHLLRSSQQPSRMTNSNQLLMVVHLLSSSQSNLHQQMTLQQMLSRTRITTTTTMVAMQPVVMVETSQPSTEESV